MRRWAEYLTLLCICGLAAVHAWAAQQKPAPQNEAKARAALEQADAAFKAGYAAMQAGKLEEARTDFARAVKFAPQVPEAHLALGAILEQLGQHAKAIPELQKALDLKPGDASTEMDLAQAHEAAAREAAGKGNPVEAESHLLKAIPLAQAVAGAEGLDAAAAAQRKAILAGMQDELGSVLAQEKRWTEAETAFREAIRLRPEGASSAGPHMHLGVVLIEEKSFVAALDELRTAEVAAPDNGMVQYQLGRGLAAAGQDEGAIPHLEKAVQLSPELPGGWLALAMSQQRLGKEAESIPLFERAVAQQPKNAEALTNLGLALTQTGKAKEALPYLQRALAETPNDPVVHQDLGAAELQMSNFDAAIAEFAKARDLDPNNPQFHYDLGLGYKLKDRTDDAIRELEKAANLDPTLPDPPYTLGILYMQIGKFDESAMQLRAALVLRPTNGDGWAILGSVLKQLEKRDEAEAALRKAIELLPNQPAAHITLAAVLAEEGKHDEASAERKIAANLSRTAVNRQRAMLNTNAGNQLLQRGEIADAVSRFQDAIAADPNYPEAHAQLALAYDRQGRTADAAAERRKAGAAGDSTSPK